MTSQQDNQQPKLQAPGAGLPLSQKIMVRFLLGPIVSKRSTWEGNRKTYEIITGKIIQLALSVPESQWTQKILVNPMRGLEDSSRFWSLDETLEHLLIVSGGIERIILGLASGNKADLEVDIAKVKPKGGGKNNLQQFTEYAPGLMQRLDQELAKSGMQKDSTLKHYHPWFGMITAHQWYWLLGMHQGIHYGQVKGIVQGLKKS